MLMPSHAVFRRLIDCLHRPQPFGFSFVLNRHASSSSSTRWKSRQSGDHFAREAKVKGLKSRAAFKLLEINEKHRIFKKGNTVIDLGYAPGSWSQVAVSRTQPNGRVIGIDIIPAQPPRGVSTMQGDFLDPVLQAKIKEYVQDPHRGRPRKPLFQPDEADGERGNVVDDGLRDTIAIEQDSERSYIDMERQMNIERGEDAEAEPTETAAGKKKLDVRAKDKAAGRVIDVVLSDMSDPWPQTTGAWVRSVSDPYRRMMNTSGISFKDHVGSMHLCLAALSFCHDTLATGGHLVCKYYQGAEDKALEKKLKRLFEKVHREKPEASRDASKEAYFVALRRKADPTVEQVFKED